MADVSRTDWKTGAVLVLTYDNTAWTDGVGAQLQRIYGIYAVSRLLGVPYLHSPLAEVGYQGLSALQANAADPDFHRAFNELLDIPSDIVPSGELPTIRLPNIGLQVANELIARTGRATGGKATLLRLMTPYGIADRFPDCYEVCKQLSPFPPSRRAGEPVRVALHVRSGDLVVVKSSDRLLPNMYYVNVARRVASTLEALKLDFRIELWTEVPTTEFVVGLQHHGINGRLNEPLVARPEMYALDEFDQLPNLVHRLNGRTIDCLRGLATADILVMSRSSFSYVAAILNRNGIIFYHPFWHSPPSSWITTDPDGRFDESRLGTALRANYKKRFFFRRR
jgi:hypothetical protein